MLPSEPVFAQSFYFGVAEAKDCWKWGSHHFLLELVKPWAFALCSQPQQQHCSWLCYGIGQVNLHGARGALSMLSDVCQMCPSPQGTAVPSLHCSSPTIFVTKGAMISELSPQRLDLTHIQHRFVSLPPDYSSNLLKGNSYWEEWIRTSTEVGDEKHLAVC